MLSKLDNELNFQRQALDLRAARQQVLAANIANSDTPNYKARDIDFSTALTNAVAGRGTGSLQMARTSDRHLEGGGGNGAYPVLYRNTPQGAVDGNTVDMDVERSDFSENAIQYQAGVTFISNQFKMLSAALQSTSS